MVGEMAFGNEDVREGDAGEVWGKKGESGFAGGWDGEWGDAKVVLVGPIEGGGGNGKSAEQRGESKQKCHCGEQRVLTQRREDAKAQSGKRAR